jgi:hypothetical protein
MRSIRHFVKKLQLFFSQFLLGMQELISPNPYLQRQSFLREPIISTEKLLYFVLSIIKGLSHDKKLLRSDLLRAVMVEIYL